MKRLCLLIIAIAFVIGANCQEGNQTFSSNYAYVCGEMDYILFPQDDYGNVSFTDTIETDITFNQLNKKLNTWLFDLESKEYVSLSDLIATDSLVFFNLEIPIGVDYFTMRITVNKIERPASRISFSTSIIYSNNQIIYRFYNFETKRYRIHGNAKDNGKPNIIHWQRVNSLKQESLEYKDKKTSRDKKNYQEKIDQIDKEKNQYQLEYDTVIDLIRDIEKLAENQ